MKERATYLTVAQAFDLVEACRPIVAAWGYNLYLVGSVLKRSDYRDVDLRCILSDEEYDQAIGPWNVKLENLGTYNKNMETMRLRLLNTAISEWLQARTGLPIDFQFQRRTQANEMYPEPRNFMGRPSTELNPPNREPLPAR